jgi:hypothetical protein
LGEGVKAFPPFRECRGIYTDERKGEINMKVFIRKPDITLYPGVRVDKDTVLEYKNDHVEQTVKDMVFHSVTKVKGDSFESVEQGKFSDEIALYSTFLEQKQG